MITLDIIPQHKVAAWLLKTIDGFLNRLGLEKDRTIEEILYVIAIVAVAVLVGWLMRKCVLWLTRKIVSVRHTIVGQELLDQRVFSRCSHIIPPLVIMGLLPFAFNGDVVPLHILQRILGAYLVVVFAVAINTVLTFIWSNYDRKENTKNLPLKGILNIGKGIVWIIAAILVVSVLIDKSPGALLAGLGAFAAALMLVFKDSILGFVAGVQLSQNDMLRVGDWIVVPSTIANGIVVDVSLTAVKVQNWDNTIVTLPPYTLVSTSFQNWRGMSDSGWRLISRSVIIDVDSVRTADDDLIKTVSSLEGMEAFMAEVKQKGGAFYDPGVATVNGSTATNLGLFRAYMCAYLLGHPLVAKNQQILVRVMTPEGGGYPLQIYCYTTTAWTAYEAVQSEIFEKVAVMAPQFGLRLFNEPSGGDVRSLRADAAKQPTLIAQNGTETPKNGAEVSAAH